MIKGLTCKFEQNQELYDKLMSTGNSRLAEASPYDKIWGIGMKAEKAERIDPDQWKGENKLGECLMTVRENLRNKELSLEEKQSIADKAAKDYNEKTNPYERAMEKGIEDVTKTANGGVSFAGTDKIYIKEDGTKCICKIEATGNRQKDFDAANEAMGLEETPDGYVWHHLDDYNVKDGTITMELVEDEAHNAAKPHSGGCAQYDAVNGPSYNPPRRGGANV